MSRMRSKTIRGLVAASMVASTVGVIGVGVPSAASAASCSTWQYEVTSKTGGYQRDLDGVYRWQHTLWSGYLVNVANRADTDLDVAVLESDGGQHVTKMVRGTVYDTHRDRVDEQDPIMLVRKDKLDYVTCW
jgi:hypothetical protein